MIEIENALIGACLAQPETIYQVRPLIKAHYLTDDGTKAVWAAMLHVIDRGVLIDRFTVASELSRMAGRDISTSTLAIYDGDPRNAVVYAKEIVDRGLSADLQKLAQDISDARGEFDERLNAAQSSLLRIVRAKYGQRDKTNIVIHQTQQEKRMNAYKTGNPITGIPTGFPKLNEMTTGWQPGNLITLGADTGAGKTYVALSFALAALQAGRGVAIYESEMTAGDVMERLAAMHCGVSLSDILDCHIDPSCLDPGYAWLQGQNLVVREAPSMTPGWLRSMSLMDAQNDRSLFIVDHLQHVSDGTGDLRSSMVTVSKTLKSIALDLSVVVIAVSQLRRMEANHSGVVRTPTQHDLKESGSIEADSDIVLLMYRKGMYDPEADRSEIDLIVAKNRNAAKYGTIKLLHLPNTRISQMWGQDAAPVIRKPAPVILEDELPF